MSADEIWDKKEQFLERTEADLRRRLTKAERVLLNRIFDEVIDRMVTEDGRLFPGGANFDALNNIGRVFEKFVRDHVVKITAKLAVSILQNADISEEYFRAEAPEVSSSKFDAAAKATREYIQDRLGIDADGKLTPSGYLNEVIDDRTIRDRVRQVMMRAIDAGEDLQGIRSRVREYLIPSRPNKHVPGPLERRFEQFAFDTLQEADAATNEQYAEALEMPAGTYAGGLIETSRCMCQKLNARTWTQEEITAFDKTEWNGKKGPLRIFRGGHRCRHQWRWIGWSALLRRRPDIQRGKGGKVIYIDGVERQELGRCA